MQFVDVKKIAYHSTSSNTPKEPKRQKTTADLYIFQCVQKCSSIPHKLTKRIYQQHAVFRQLETKIWREGEGGSAGSGHIVSPVSVGICICYLVYFKQFPNN